MNYRSTKFNSLNIVSTEILTRFDEAFSSPHWGTELKKVLFTVLNDSDAGSIGTFRIVNFPEF